MIVAVTGHRPDKLGGYSRELNRALSEFALRWIGSQRPSGVITGMALGWDQAVAIACIRLGIPFTAAIPFDGQESRWPERAQHDYRMLLQAASMVHVVCDLDHYRNDPPEVAIRGMLHARNEWMVDNSTGLLALYNGDREGGTFNCVEYAKAGRREITNLWPVWEAWWDGGLYLV